MHPLTELYGQKMIVWPKTARPWIPNKMHFNYYTLDQNMVFALCIATLVNNIFMTNATTLLMHQPWPTPWICQPHYHGKSPSGGNGSMLRGEGPIVAFSKLSIHID